MNTMYLQVIVDGELSDNVLHAFTRANMYISYYKKT